MVALYEVRCRQAADNVIGGKWVANHGASERERRCTQNKGWRRTTARERWLPSRNPAKAFGRGVLSKRNNTPTLSCRVCGQACGICDVVLVSVKPNLRISRFNAQI